MLIAALLVAVLGLFFLQDTTTVTEPPDRLGVFGTLLNAVWPFAVATFQSFAVKWWSAHSAQFAAKSAAFKIAVLFGIGFVVNVAFALLGHPLVNPDVSTWGTAGTAGILSVVQTLAAAVIYYFGKHRVPVAPSESAARRKRNASKPLRSDPEQPIRPANRPNNPTDFDPTA